MRKVLFLAVFGIMLANLAYCAEIVFVDNDGKLFVSSAKMARVTNDRFAVFSNEGITASLYAQEDGSDKIVCSNDGKDVYMIFYMNDKENVGAIACSDSDKVNSEINIPSNTANRSAVVLSDALKHDNDKQRAVFSSTKEIEAVLSISDSSL